MENRGILYLIPTTLGDTAETADVLPVRVNSVINSVDEYIVENEKSARHYLKKMGIKKPLQEIILHPLNQHTEMHEISSYLNSLDSGKSIGVISEAGCPGVADPGAEVVRLAHEKNIRVIPLVGPSSILLSLMASGFNGQSFAFNGYLPKERADRIKKIKDLEFLAVKKNQTQLFIETPYRNMHLLEDLLGTCDNNTKLCVACDVTLNTEFIKTRTVGSWKKQLPDLNKRPTIFLINR
ncbi:MAG: Uroporphyrin-III C/tetrapyrrole (Corrin/Porphyrin) methyltransferase [Bacteroidota bacterium]|jgi:16S rRNA (cytidine1402-2'-O)-methyltransferase|nr:Uroporphyrin-III C/tetrapyrrole (Corrin/Porphyrin) methyltransferase [Bacteroidota bacterium]